MKPILCLLLVWQGVKSVQSYNYKYPFLQSITYNPEPGRSALNLTWNAVPNWDQKDPVVGYKIAVWEMKTGKKIEHRFINGTLIDEKIEDDTFPAKIPIGPPKITTVTADQRTITYGDLKSEVWYEYSGLAFTKTGEGPLSPIIGIKLSRSTNTTEAK